MYKNLFILSFLISAITLPYMALGEIYKQVDSEGRVTYSNVKLKGSKKLELEPTDTSFGNEVTAPNRSVTRNPSNKTPTPSAFPKVDANTQNQRDGKRKDILLSELESEKRALANAKIALTEGEKNPEVYQRKNANGTSSTFRNVAKFDEKMKDLQSNVDAHQRNIDLLSKELGALN